jgi:hypothetical protein
MDSTLLDTLRTLNLTTDLSQIINITQLVEVDLYKADFDRFVLGSDNYTALNTTLYLRESQRVAKMDQIRFGSAQISKIVIFGLLVLIAFWLSIAPLRAWMSARRPKKCQAILLVVMTYALVSASI